MKFFVLACTLLFAPIFSAHAVPEPAAQPELVISTDKFEQDFENDLDELFDDGVVGCSGGRTRDNCW
jgi:hypothetical protein